MISGESEARGIAEYEAEQLRIRAMLYELCSLADNAGKFTELPKPQQEWYARERNRKRFQKSTVVACSPKG